MSRPWPKMIKPESDCDLNKLRETGGSNDLETLLFWVPQFVSKNPVRWLMSVSCMKEGWVRRFYKLKYHGVVFFQGIK